MREPAEIRATCAAKLANIETGPQFTALLACLLGEEWTTPKIAELCISTDRCVLARLDGEAGFKVFIGAEADLIQNIHGIAEIGELDSDEIGYLLGKVAAIQSQPRMTL
jgi:hypothetical protein